MTDWVDNLAGEDEEEVQQEAQEEVTEDAVQEEEEVQEPEANEADAVLEEEAEETEEKESKEVTGLKNEMLKERKKRQEYEQKFDYLAKQLADLQAQNQPEEPKQELPNFEADPVGNLQGRIQGHEEKIAEYEQHQRAQAEQAQINQVLSVVQEQFLEQKPDYYDAIQFIREKAVSDMIEKGASRPVAMQQVAQYELQWAESMIRTGQNPAALAYGQALVQGYVPASAKTADEPAQNQTDPEEVQRLEEGLKAAKGSGGGSGKKKVTGQVLRDSTFPELDEVIAELKADAKFN